MIKNRAGSVVLVDDRKKPDGIVTERDLLKVSDSNKLPENIAAKNIMSSPVVTIKAYDSETAAALMAKSRIKRLVVVEQNGALAGVLSTNDIARKLVRILADDCNRYGHLKAGPDL